MTMRYILNAEQMKAADQYSIRQLLISSAVLMERAALAVCDAAEEMLCGKKRIIVICGSGNNGGDGFAAARIMRERGYEAAVLLAGDPAHMSADCALQQEIWTRTGGATYTDPGDTPGADLIIDAMLGIGLSRDVSGRYADMIQWVNHSGLPVLAVDIPSGIDADNGKVRGCAVRAVRTVTFAALKYGHILFPGTEYCGMVTTAQIGISPENVHPQCFLPDPEDIAALLPRRPRRSNKGTFGKALILAGHSGMAGASILSGSGAYRSGAGIVTICGDDENRIPLQGALPEAIWLPWSETDRLEKAVRACNAAAIGPGLGTDERSGQILRQFLSFWEQESREKTLVADADALNLFAKTGMPRFPLMWETDPVTENLVTSGPVAEKPVAENPVTGSPAEESPVTEKTEAENVVTGSPVKKGVLEGKTAAASAGMIITPHPGEMARLTGLSAAQVCEDPVRTAAAFAAEHELICVLKDAVTVVTDGRRTCLINTGCSGMATGGSGDVLTGVICSLLAQGMRPFEAAFTGAWLHGKAGSAAAKAVGERGMTAGDIVRHLPEVMSVCRP